MSVTARMSLVLRGFTPGAVVWSVLALGLVLSPLSTKVAGAVWLFFCIWGIAWFFRRPAAGADAAGLASVTLPWIASCALATVLAGTALWYWRDPFDGINAELRLLLAALALHGQLCRGGPLPAHFKRHATDALALGCVAAFGCVTVLAMLHEQPRDYLPANAIVWALAAAFVLCLVVPMVLDGDATVLRRRLWALGGALGAGAVLFSQSRGALGIFAWTLWLIAGHFRRRDGRWVPVKIVALLAACAAAIAVAWVLPGDPLRMHAIERDIVTAEEKSDYNSSMGTRLYLWSMGWDGIRESPWVGIGGAERLRRIKNAGLELDPQGKQLLHAVRTMGHVHNQYLHSGLDGGLMGIGAILVLVGGMLLLARRLGRTDALAARQLYGVTFIHVTSATTNVNFAHNYYVVSLAVVIAVIVLGARMRSPSDGQALVSKATLPPPSARP